MPVCDAAAEEDSVEKLPPTAPLNADQCRIHAADQGQGKSPPEPTVKEDLMVDEFDLPVKPPRRRRSADERSAADNNVRGIGEDGKGTNTLHSRTSSESQSLRNESGLTPHNGQSSPDLHEVPIPKTTEVDGLDLNSSAAPMAEVPGSTIVAAAGGVSGWSHQTLASHRESEERHEEEEWQEMPSLAPYDLYDDDGKLIAREARESDDEENAYTGLGGAGKGYTRVQDDEDAHSQTSMDENTSYLFKPKEGEFTEEDDAQRDPLAQMQATKDLLTEGQRIAYVGLARLAMAEMVSFLENIEPTKGTKKELRTATESTKMWNQQMMVRLYSHMDINSSEQVMIEQLAEHGVQPRDLTPALLQNARVKNPMAESVRHSTSSPQPDGVNLEQEDSPALTVDGTGSHPLPAYQKQDGADMPRVRTPSQLPASRDIDIDLRWTVLCDLFLLLVADSIYDARSRTLLEKVGDSLEVPWLDICRFEKRVTDSLEMQEAANKETWNESDHMENRRKLALKRRYMMMGLATVGGSLVIGLSAGLLAPVIGAGLAAGFTTIGVAGTGGFLAGAGGTAIITSGAVLTGGTIAVRASNRRTGAVRTFEYRPLHNNKRVNLIVTISGWMNGKIDDVRLPYSTIDPIMGDMYSVLWEPEMLQSMGDTIKVLATEVSAMKNSTSSTDLLDLGTDPGFTTSVGKHNIGRFDGIIAIADCSI